MNHERAPLFEGLLNHQKRRTTPFHIPGHKRGKGMDSEFRDFIGPNALDIDLINIAPLDDLHHPHGMIDEAQTLAADAFGADYTFFSVQGTSGAIMTMIMSVCGPDDKIIVPRNVHKSIMSAIIFSGASPVFIHPELDEELGISHGVSTATVERAIQAHPDAKALLVINPTYFGTACDLTAVTKTAHSYNIPVLVDEAHGVHIHFHDEYPVSAMQAGCDLAATSVHKLGGSMTQSSVLNVQGTLVSPSRVQSVISMLTTTSTSYILLASLDTARRHLAVNGTTEMERILSLSRHLRTSVNQIPGLHSPGREMLNGEARYDLDETKLIISVKELGISGYDAEVWLREQADIEVELSDLYNILCVITFADDDSTTQILLRGLEQLSRHFLPARTWEENGWNVEIPNIPTLSLSPREAFYAETETIRFQEAAGRTSAEFVMVYPPGIPIFIPGEIIEQKNIDYVFTNFHSGLPVQGPEDSTLEYIKVIKEHRAII
ncbi:aminotransferase class I/II-fold pyridoxal phosphate-dependent enzyme [Alkalicoccus urumqiensis]|uniref:aminotransferase class I/II-fold pyridoxal phosphate-dependent enzyme n=1 Tax=Alkalicoccus urumqiensis TaxID=1548213 RepID=UPI003CCA2705